MIILPPTFEAGSRANCYLATPNWSDVAVLTGSAVEAGTALANLQTMQPTDPWGSAVSLPPYIEADRGSAQLFNLVSLLFTNATGSGTWKVRAGDSVNELRELQAPDGTTNANNGLLGGGATWGSPKFGVGALFLVNPTSGVTGQHVAVPAHASLQATSFTYELWVYPDELRAQAMLDHVGGAGRRLRMVTVAGVPGYIQFETGTGGGAVLSNMPIPIGTWTHLALSFDNTTKNARLYLKGALENEITHTAGYGDGSGQVGIGTAGIDYSFGGRIDDVRYWKTVRTPEMIQAYRDAELSSSQIADPLLAGYWRMNGYDSGTLPLWASPGLDTWTYRHALHVIPGGITKRYVRLDCADATLPGGFLRAGRLYISAAFQPRVNFSFGRRFRFLDESHRERTLSGQTIPTRRVPIPVVEFSLPALSEEEALSNAYEIDRLRAASRDVLIVFDATDPVHRHKKMIYGLLEPGLPLTHYAFDLYEHPYSVEALL